MPGYGLRASPKPSKRRAESEETEETYKSVKKSRPSPGSNKKQAAVLPSTEKHADRKTSQSRRDKNPEHRARRDSGALLPTLDNSIMPSCIKETSPAPLTHTTPTPPPQKKPRLTRPSRPAPTAVDQPNIPPFPTSRTSYHRPSIDIHTIRQRALSRGPQLTPNGLGLDLSPHQLSSPETPDALAALPPLTKSNMLPSPTKHIAYLVKRIRRGKSPPCYWPFDIVSGGTPPNVPSSEVQFWEERAEHQALGTSTFVQCSLPDRYGRLWRCPKVLFEGYREVGWERDAEREERREATRRKEGMMVSPGTFPSIEQQSEEEFCAFSNMVDLFLEVVEGSGDG